MDVDSKIPNLALMRISRYLKMKGEKVQLCQIGKDEIPHGQFLTVWISCVFTWNRALAESLKRQFEHGAIVSMGGSGISLEIRLPGAIETLTPDYTLYDDDRAIGFIQRGCIRACDFCAVHRKEGWLKDNEYKPLSDWADGFSKVLLLDNEFAAMSPDVYQGVSDDREGDTIRTAKERGQKLSITQGYDVRCVNERKANQLADWKPWDLKFNERRLYIAWDYLGIEPFVTRAIELLLKAGFKGREIMCYCLVGQRSSHAEDQHRFDVLWKKYGVLPFMMRYRPLDGSPAKNDRWLSAWCRYVNRGPASYRNHTFDEYLEHRRIVLN